MKYAKHIYLKYTEGKPLSDAEVLDGSVALSELSKDLSECFGMKDASVEAMDISNRLKALAKQRGIA